MSLSEAFCKKLFAKHGGIQTPKINVNASTWDER